MAALAAQSDDPVLAVQIGRSAVAGVGAGAFCRPQSCAVSNRTVESRLSPTPSLLTGLGCKGRDGLIKVYEDSEKADGWVRVHLGPYIFSKAFWGYILFCYSWKGTKRNKY